MNTRLSSAFLLGVGILMASSVQNELLDCMYQVYIEELIKEINDATFVSVQADETTDITCRSQFVIILRCIKG